MRTITQRNPESNYRASHTAAQYNGETRAGHKTSQDPQLQDISPSGPPYETSCSGRASLSTASGHHAHSHWCTICKDPSPIMTCDGWKRHEKEQHEKGYACMPNGPIEITRSGRHCAFCGLSNPDQKHLDTHATVLCVRASTRDRRYTRRFQLVKHLEVHGIFNGTGLADSWRIHLKKRYYSCGFCVALFLSNGDRLNHIDVCHFRRFQLIDQWNPNVVIRGLLLQPAVLECWKEKTIYDIRSANLTWDPHVIASLQPRLEMSEEPAENLAADALYQSRLASGAILPAQMLAFVKREPQAHANQELQIENGRNIIVQSKGSEPHVCSEPTTQVPLHLRAPDLQYNAMPLEPRDLGTTDLPSPHVSTDYSRMGIAGDIVYYDPMSQLSLSNSAINNPYPTQVSQNHPGLPLDIQGSDYVAASSQRQPSTTYSWCSSSLASTNTSVHSLPTTLPFSHNHFQTSVNPEPISTHPTFPPPTNTSANSCWHKKSPSMIAQLRRRFSRAKMRQVDTEPDVVMDIDIDDIMRIMEDDSQSRTNVNTRHEVSNQ